MHSAAASSPTAHAHIHAHAHEHAHTYIHIHIHIHIHLPIPIPMLMSKMTLRGKYLPKSVCQPISFYWCNLCTVVEHPFGSYLTVCGPVKINSLFYEYVCGCFCQNWCGSIFQPIVTILIVVLDCFLC